MDDEAGAAAYDRFYASVQRRLVGQAYLLTGSLPDAEDLAQEALWRAWREWRRLRGYDDPEAWVRGVLHHLAVSRWRRDRTRRRHEARLVEPAAGVALPLDAGQLELVAAVRQLPPHQRRAIVLKAVAGLDVGEIAVEMGASPGTVRVWLSRARRSLERSLGPAEATPANEVPERRETRRIEP